jgi:membrane-associated phospholipid phosphatase
MINPFANYRRSTVDWLTLFRRRNQSAHDKISHDALRVAWLGPLLLVLSVALSVALILDPVLGAHPFSATDWLYQFAARWTTLGESHWYLVPTALFVLATGFVDWPSRGRTFKLRLCAWIEAAWFGFLAIAGSGLIATIAKQLIGRARPTQFAEFGPYHFDLMRFGYDYASFPSGHSTTVGALCCAIALLWPRLTGPMIVAAIWLGSTRMVLGVHYPSDVLAGLGFGAWFSYALAVWFARRRFLFTADNCGWLRRKPQTALFPGLASTPLSSRRKW